MAYTKSLPKWLQVIAALDAQPDKYEWRAICADCGEYHTNFALRWRNDGLTPNPHPAIVWHNCGQLDTCCGCHIADSNKDCCYFGSEVDDSETMDNLAYEWATAQGL